MGLLDVLGLKKAAAGATGGATVAAAKSGPAAAPDPKRIAYEAARVDVDRLARALGTHPQRAKVQSQITTAQASFAAADAHAVASSWPQATLALADAKQRFERARATADLWIEYLAKRAAMRAAAMSLEGFWSDAAVKAINAALKSAEQNANANPPTLAAAIKKLSDAEKVVQASLKADIDAAKTQLATVTGGAATLQAFASAEIATAQTTIATADAALAAGNWSQVAQSVMVVTFSIPALQRFAGRHGTYQTERTPIAAQLDGLKAQPALAPRVAPLEALLVQADAQANHDTMQFERGSALLKDLAARCTSWQAVAAIVGDFDAQKRLAEQEAAVLDAHAAAAAVANERAAVRNLLQQADTTARAGAAAVDPGPDFRQALALIVRGRADLQTAKARADGMGPVNDAKKAADKGDAAGLKKAIDDLGKAFAATAATPQAAASAALVTQGKAQLAEASKALAAKNTPSTARALKQAADTLDAARTAQAKQTQAESQVPAVKARLKAVQASPRAVAIKSPIDTLVAAIGTVDTAIAARDAPAALTAIAEADKAATAAEAADAARAAWDKAVAPIRVKVAAVANKDDKKKLEGLLKGADAHADALRFAEAETARKRIAVEIDKAALDRATKKKPPVPADCRALASSMAANGGGAEVDAMIQDPALSDPDVVAAMAGGRFNIVLRAHSNLQKPRTHRTENLKALAATFAKVPEHVAAHGSITRIDSFDSKKGSGGAWNADGTVELTGRPNVNDQTYGSGMMVKDASGKAVSQLPGTIDPDCQTAAGAKTDLLSFTALHEVGHGVDDSLTYMARNGMKPDHGGWKEYGTGLQEVADAVGPHIATQVSGSNFYGTPEQKTYVLARLMTQPADKPAGLVAGSPEALAYKAFDDWLALATSDGIWERDGDAQSIAVGGRIYHEAYKRNWVSYLQAARSKGLTGYQFRSPAEWFAEVYAGFHSGVLGPNHPSRAWLAKL